MARKRNQRNFNRIVAKLPWLEAWSRGENAALPELGAGFKLTSSGWMDLSIHMLAIDESGPDSIQVSLTHYSELNGDLMSDPDMEIRLVRSMKCAVPLSWRNDFAGVAQRVFSSDGKRYSPRLLRELDGFLDTWLRNLKHQGHSYAPEKAS